MQISAHTRPQMPALQGRAQPSDPVATLADAVGLSSGREGGQPGGYARDGRQTTAEPQPAKSADKTVFVARSLSSTLNQLQIASFAAEFPSPATRPEPRSADAQASLDELISTFLSAAFFLSL